MKKNVENVEVATVETKVSEPIVKTTAVEDRLYELVELKELKELKSKQGMIVLSILKNENRPMKIAEVAELATELKAVGGIEPSVRYHLHHLAKDGIVKVTNPTFILS